VTDAPFDPWKGIAVTTRIKEGLGFDPIFPSLRTTQQAGVLYRKGSCCEVSGLAFVVDPRRSIKL